MLKKLRKKIAFWLLGGEPTLEMNPHGIKAEKDDLRLPEDDNVMSCENGFLLKAGVRVKNSGIPTLPFYSGYFSREKCVETNKV